MKTFKELIALNIITEEIHKELQSILDEPEDDRANKLGVNAHTKKLNRFVKTFKTLSTAREDTGLEGGTPKKGSSRAVFFPSEHKQIHIDGKPVGQPTAVKIAFPGTLDKHTGDANLLGEHQNRIEADRYTTQAHSMLTEGRDGHYTSNHSGVTAPVLDTHPDNHWLEMARAEKMSGAKFKSMTKLRSHPDGLDFNDFVDVLQRSHAEAHGVPHYGRFLHSDEIEHIRQHPLYQSTEDFIHDTGNHPGDLRLQNYGVWKHPVSGKDYPVIRDYGFSNDIAKLYSKARRNQYAAR